MKTLQQLQEEILKEFDEKYGDFLHLASPAFKGVPDPKDVKSFLLQAIEMVARETIERMIVEIFSLQMSDPFGYGNAKIEVYDLEQWAEKYGYTPDKIREALTESERLKEEFLTGKEIKKK